MQISPKRTVNTLVSAGASKSLQCKLRLECPAAPGPRGEDSGLPADLEMH